MKYTAEQLLEYVKENNYCEALRNAVAFNAYDYRLYTVKGMVRKGEQGDYRFASDRSDTENLQLDCSFGGFPEGRYPLPAAVVAYIASVKEELSILGFTGQTEETDEMMDVVCLDFLRTTKTDTHGKLKKLLRDGYEVIESPFAN